MLHLLKQLSFSKTFPLLVSIPLCCLKIIYLLRHYLHFAVNHVTSFSRQKTFKIEKPKKTYDYCLSTKFCHPANFGLKKKRTVNWSSSQSAVSDVKLTRRDKFECTFEKKRYRKIVIDKLEKRCYDWLTKERRNIYLMTVENLQSSKCARARRWRKNYALRWCAIWQPRAFITLIVGSAICYFCHMN